MSASADVAERPAADQSAIIDALVAIVGDKHVLRDPVDMQSYLREPRDLFHGQATCIVRPSNVGEVSAVLKLCHETRTMLVPQGGNTGLVGGQIPDLGTEIVLSLGRMKRVREVDASSNTMIVEAGMTLLDVQEEAARADRLFPLSLGSEGTCTIGGNLATNAGGTAVLAYGNARDLVTGLEVVLADGRVLSNLSKLRKDNTGYDLKNLFIGSEGTLGIITAAVVKLYPKPRAIETAVIGIADPHKALALLTLAQAKAGHELTTFELMPRIGIDFVLRHGVDTRDPLEARHDWYVLLELSSQAESIEPAMMAILEEGLEGGLIEDAALATSLDQRGAFWKLRDLLPDVQSREGGSIKHDVSVPVARIPRFLDEVTAAVEAAVPGVRMVPFGHMGDGNIHCNVSQPLGADKAAYLARWDEVNTIVHGIVATHQGSISAEHGIGRLKRDLLPGVKDPVAMEVMRALKRTLDPRGILNPGKVI